MTTHFSKIVKQIKLPREKLLLADDKLLKLFAQILERYNDLITYKEFNISFKTGNTLIVFQCIKSTKNQCRAAYPN